VTDGRIPVLTFVPVPGGTEHDGKVLSFCYYQSRKVSEIAEYLGISDSTYFRQQVLGNLEANGYLEKSKVSRATFYKTKPEMVSLD
jgi:DNA-binding IclR family transcriptional regulator